MPASFFAAHQSAAPAQRRSSSICASHAGPALRHERRSPLPDPLLATPSHLSSCRSTTMIFWAALLFYCKKHPNCPATFTNQASDPSRIEWEFGLCPRPCLHIHSESTQIVTTCVNNFIREQFAQSCPSALVKSTPAFWPSTITSTVTKPGFVTFYSYS